MLKTVIVMENNKKNLLLLLAFVAFLGTTIRQAEGKNIPQTALDATLNMPTILL
jgi:hypothetical protein